MRNTNTVSTLLRASCLALAVTTTAISISAGDRSHPIRAGHNLLQDDTSRPALAIGEPLPPLGVRDATGRVLRIAELTRKGPVALVFLSTTCPLAKRYVERLKLLDETYAAKGVSLIGVFPNADGGGRPSDGASSGRLNRRGP